MCAGPDAALLRDDMKETIYGAFAGLEANSVTRTLPAYKNWVEKLATKEYADELVVIACAIELDVTIICVPHTPAGSPDQWAISIYKPTHTETREDRTIYLGNNDVHYMWLAHP